MMVFLISERRTITQTGLYSHRRRLAAQTFGAKKKRICTIGVVKTKALIIGAVTAQLICLFRKSKNPIFS